MRMKLIVSPESLADRMDRKDFSNRELAKYAEVSPGTIDNLVRGDTKSVNKGRTAELICKALDVPLDVYFVPEISSTASETGKRCNDREVSRRRAGKLGVA
ncbi:helix-turn-helix transcriptional regulator [Glutamicibacter sp.]|uniref:helix-turn-helix domain-containing protein n=1 Tax=Glutamicibacter sp. TaxID=1931995 RepID=UPI0028BD3FAB|nr:helix-turn-helix transcriptional regulator [Glutamicibacter sp.]